MDVDAGVVDDRATRMLPLALTKSTSRFGVRLGPRPGGLLASRGRLLPREAICTFDLGRHKDEVVVRPLAEVEQLQLLAARRLVADIVPSRCQDSSAAAQAHAIGRQSGSARSLTRQVAEEVLVRILVGDVVQHHEQAAARRAHRRHRRGKEQDNHAQKRPHRSIPWVLVVGYVWC